MDDVVTNPDFSQLTIAASTLLVGLLSFALVHLVRFVGTKTKSDLLTRAATALRIAVVTAVKEVSQEYISGIKEGRADGKLTAEEKARAKQRALAKAKSYLGARGLALLVQGFRLDPGGIDAFLGGHIEAAVHDVKLESAAASVRPLPSSAAG